jgi:hypothetical protein
MKTVISRNQRQVLRSADDDNFVSGENFITERKTGSPNDTTND